MRYHTAFNSAFRRPEMETDGQRQWKVEFLPWNRGNSPAWKAGLPPCWEGARVHFPAEWKAIQGQA